MANFFTIKEKSIKSKGIKQVYPAFKVISNSGLMIKGGKFYALWDEENKIWSKNEFDLIRLVDSEIDKYNEEHGYNKVKDMVQPMYLSEYESSTWQQYKKYTALMPDNYRPLDQKVVFANYIPKKTDYVSHKLPYDRIEGPSPAYDELMHKFYAPEELEKLEWAIGSIFCGDSTKIQKFIVLRGDAGTGKSTMLNIIDKLFEGYTAAFKAKDLVSGDNQFAGDAFANNPLVGINGDADLSNIKDNSILNTIIAHEKMVINEKYKTKYELKPGTFLFVGTNNKVRITDARSGLIRRIIDVTPTGETFPESKYDRLVAKVDNELGQIADHCIKVYESLGKSYYSGYKPLTMMYNSDPIFNFVEERYLEYKRNDGCMLNDEYLLYKRFCDENGINHILRKYEFKDELQAYFKTYYDRLQAEGDRKRCYFEGFKINKFQSNLKAEPVESWLNLNKRISLIDDILKDMPAQYQDDHRSRPLNKWSNCNTKLSDLDTTKIHFVKMPLNHIVIDFDLKDKSGEKSAELNLKAAEKWPETYAEFSKSGSGIHLHYIYDGDPTMLKCVYDEHIEIKVFNGDSSLRRKLTKCNDIPLVHLKEGDLPLKEKKNKMYDNTKVDSDNIRRRIKHTIKTKEPWGNTTQSCQFIKQILDDAYYSGKPYDVRDILPSCISFAASATNKSEYCMKLIKGLHFCSDNVSDDEFIAPDSKEYLNAPIAFFDVEVFPNLFVLNWKLLGDKKVQRMINPDPNEVWMMFCTNKYRWVGFNNRRYDNHIVKAWANGDRTNQDLYDLSQRIIVYKDQNAFLIDAWNISYTDIYDYAKKKQGLKKWEIDLGIHHQELGLPWDQPVPKELWGKVAEYCDNDVNATEAVWNATQGDFLARKILAEIAGGIPNQSTNKLSEMFIFEGNKNPQSEFNYRFMGKPEEGQEDLDIWDDGITAFQPNGKPVFLGYEFNRGKSSYLDVEEVGEGGYVFAESGNNSVHPKENGGMYGRTITLDVASMHPSSAIAENLFGDYYTKRFKEILDLRIAIKHGDFDKAKKMFDGKLIKYLNDPEMAGALADALKIVINSVYGLTAAKFDTAFRDKRNIDNIVAKRGALFMVNLRNLVQRKGYTVVHIKTDSIKIADPDEEIINFVVEYGKKFGYNFEVEHIFDKICLVNNAVYIAKLAKDDPDWKKDCKKAKEKGLPEPTRWTATGDQFAVPYVFKTLFSGENIQFSDLCETKSVNVGDIYLDFNETLPDVSMYEDCKFARMDLDNGKKLTRKQQALLDELSKVSDEELDRLISEGHEYRFVGKVGLFCPVIKGVGGGTMYRNDGTKNFAVEGTKGWIWKEAEVVKAIDGFDRDQIDFRYFDELVDKAKDKISQYGDYEWFVS